MPHDHEIPEHHLREHLDGSSHAFFYITFECNARCSYCYIGNERLNTGTRMPFEHVRAALKTLRADMNCSTVTFLGGEPLLHPDFISIVSEARGLGMKVIVDTNGTLARVTPLELKELEVNCVSFSIDSFNNSLNARLRKKGLLDASVEAINSVKAQGMLTRITVVLTALNCGELPEIISTATKMRVDILNLHVFMPQGNGKANSHLALSRDQLKNVLDACWAYSKSEHLMELRFPVLWIGDDNPVATPESLGYSGCLARARDSLNIYPDGSFTYCPLIQGECSHGTITPNGVASIPTGESRLQETTPKDGCYWTSVNPEAAAYYAKTFTPHNRTICPAWKASSFRIYKMYTEEVCRP